MKHDGFYFIPKKWLGDSNIIAMDWDCRGMHLHLMAIAWQQQPKGYLLDDEVLIRKLLGNPPIEDWENRIKPQIFSAWKIKLLDDGNGVKRRYWYQPGIIKTLQSQTQSQIEQENKTKRRSKKLESKELIEFENPEFIGFNLESILNFKPSATILYEHASQEQKNTIWNIGVQLLSRYGQPETKSRSFLAKLVKEYGAKPVAEAIAQLSISNSLPVEIHSYLIGILKKQQETEKKKTGRGFVAL